MSVKKKKKKKKKKTRPRPGLFVCVWNGTKRERNEKFTAIFEKNKI